MTGLEEKIRNLIKQIEEERRLADKRAKQLYDLITGPGLSAIKFNSTVSDVASGLTESTSYQDLDLTSYTSANAKGVILVARISRVLADGNHIEPFMAFRQNGSSVSLHAAVAATFDNRSGTSQTFYQSGQIFVPCDGGQIIEWKVQPDSNTIVENLYVVGYWE